ncbi:MAG: glucose-1-phosphate cytidylyltransferase [bacterium]|nr:glucose-1-phosphate cytidylyltransferase [bacterium]
MKTVILAGGLGTRLQEETALKPKPMVEIGGRPILWHIMQMYGAHGFQEFVVALGYKGDVIKDYFLHYRYRTHDLSVDLRTGDVKVHDGATDPWTVHLLETGLAVETGGRVKRAAAAVGSETFFLTYGDGVADINLHKLLAFHRLHGRLATLTAARPSGRFGHVGLEGDAVAHFEEKPEVGEGWINGGFFVLEPGIADYIAGDDTIFEREPLERLAREGQLMAYRHEGFWQCMDTLRDVRLLENIWQSGKVPWRIPQQQPARAELRSVDP